MLVSTKDQGLGRHRRSYSHSSIYSNHRSRAPIDHSKGDHSRGLDGGGGGGTSDSTGAHDSFTKSSSIRRRSRRRKEPDRSCAMEAVHEETISNKEVVLHDPTIPNEDAVDDGGDDKANEKVDVFAFLVKEDADTETEEAQDDTALGYDGEDRHHFDENHPDFDPSLPEHCYRINDQARLNARLPCPDEEEEPGSSHSGGEGLKTHWNWPEVPRPRHQMKVPGSDYEEHSSSFADTPVMEREQYMKKSVSFATETLGFEQAPPSILYDKLTKGGHDFASVSPARCFRWANKRILLHLQQEIFELEIELKGLDRAIGDSNSSSRSPTAPGRSPSWQINQRQQQQHLYSARAEILDRLQAKLEKYNRMLLTSTTLSRLAERSPILPEMRERIRAALRRPGEEDLAYLRSIFDDDSDMFSVLSFRDRIADDINYSHVLAVFLSAIIPLLAFRICPGFLLRIIILVFTMTISICGLAKLGNAVTTTDISSNSSSFDRHRLEICVLVGSAISLFGVFLQ